MDIIIGWQSYETTFMDATVTMRLRPLKRKAMLALTPFMQVASGDGASKKTGDDVSKKTGDDVIKLAINSLKMQELAAAILPDHMKDLEGITINGQTPTIEDLVDESVLCNLVVDIIGQLATISNLKREAEKNSAAPSGSTTPDGGKTP